MEEPDVSADFLDALHRVTLGRGFAVGAVDGERAFQNDPAHRTGKRALERFLLLGSDRGATSCIAEKVTDTADEKQRDRAQEPTLHVVLRAIVRTGGSALSRAKACAKIET